MFSLCIPFAVCAGSVVLILLDSQLKKWGHGLLYLKCHVFNLGFMLQLVELFSDFDIYL
jgi:hypothetical protein